VDPQLQHQVEALNARAVSFARSGQPQLAEQLWSQALDLDPDAVPIRTNLARLYFQIGRFADVLKLSAYLETQAAYPAALAALIGQAALRLDEPATALRWLTVADRMRPNESALQLSLSEALLSCGHVQQAAALLMILVERHPDAVEPQLNLALALTESGSIQNASSCYARLLAQWPSHPAVLMNAARFHLEYDNRQIARRLIDDLFALEPDSRVARTLLAELLRLDGELEAARSHWLRLLEQEPSDMEAILPLIFTSMERGDWSDAADRLQLAFACCSGPIPSRLLAAWADLPPRLRQARFPQWPLQYSALVQQHQLINADDPQLSQWIDWLMAEPSLIENRPGKPTVGGLQSHELLNRCEDPLSQSLLSVLSPAVEVYRNQLRDQFPLQPDQGSSVSDRYSGWAVVLRPGGQQLRHTHPEARISGVFYLRMPPSHDSESSNAGDLWFSPNPLWQDPCKGLTVHPRPGLLVLFPSFMPHETIPFVTKGDRICIAFNVS
jgi:tetratricopeptide (TPR) repeat protein